MDAGYFEGLLYNILSEKKTSRIIDLIWQIKRMIIPYPIIFSAFSNPNKKNIDMSYLSCNNKKQSIKRLLVYYVIERNIIKRNNI